MKKVFLSLFFLWIILSILTLPYNALNTVLDIKSWFFLTDNQKREKIFGDTYDYIYFINSKTPKNSNIYIFSKDGKIGLIARYFLYPRKLYVTKDDSNLINLLKHESFDYISLYDKEKIIQNYKLFAKYQSKTTFHFGIIYKKI